MSNAEMKSAKDRAERLEFVEDKIKELSTLIGNTIVRFAEDPYKAHDEAEEDTLFGSYFGQE